MGDVTIMTAEELAAATCKHCKVFGCICKPVEVQRQRDALLVEVERLCKLAAAERALRKASVRLWSFEAQNPHMSSGKRARELAVAEQAAMTALREAGGEP